MPSQIQWVSADGTQTIYLTDPVAGYRVQAAGTSGLNAPTYRFASDHYAGIDGAAVQAVTAEPREVTLGLLVQAPDEDTLEQRTRALTRAMRPKVGPGTLVVSRAGVTRNLTCYYVAGLEGSEARGEKLPGRWWKFAVRFFAEDPWWYGDPREITVGLGAGAPFFPIFPLRLSPSVVQGEFTVDLSDTDDPTHPVWTITGPGASLALTNETTGRSIEVDADIPPGEIIVINTRPGERSVRRGDGTLLTSALVGDPAMWPLIEDVNQVTAQLVGATSASRIYGVYSPKYAGA